MHLELGAVSVPLLHTKMSMKSCSDQRGFGLTAFGLTRVYCTIVHKVAVT
jgi:hypothetical protein